MSKLFVAVVVGIVFSVQFSFDGAHDRSVVSAGICAHAAEPGIKQQAPPQPPKPRKGDAEKARAAAEQAANPDRHVLGAVAALQQMKLAPVNDADPRHFTVTPFTIAHLEALMNQKKTIVVEDDGTISIK